MAPLVTPNRAPISLSVHPSSYSMTASRSSAPESLRTRGLPWAVDGIDTAAEVHDHSFRRPGPAWPLRSPGPAGRRVLRIHHCRALVRRSTPVGALTQRYPPGQAPSCVQPHTRQARRRGWPPAFTGSISAARSSAAARSCCAARGWRVRRSASAEPASPRAGVAISPTRPRTLHPRPLRDRRHH